MEMKLNMTASGQSISPLVKKRAALNSRSRIKKTSGAQLALAGRNDERRSTRAREIFSALAKRSRQKNSAHFALVLKTTRSLCARIEIA